MNSFGRSVGLPLFVVGGFAAVAIAERLQLWQSGREIPAVVLLAALPLGCAGLGAIGVRWLTELDVVLAWRLLMGVAAVGGAWVYVVVHTAAWVVAVEAGLVALLVAPALLVLARLTLRPPARAGSLLARASERVRWGVVGGVACVGAALALPDWYGLRQFHGSGTQAVWVGVALALGTLGACALSSAWDLHRARQACREEASLQPVTAGHVSADTRLLDIGVGNRMLGAVLHEGRAYRSCERVSRVVVGDPALGASRLARAHRRLLWGCLAAVVSVVLGAGYAIAKPYVVEIEPQSRGVAEAWKPVPPVTERVPGSPGLRTLTPPSL